MESQEKATSKKLTTLKKFKHWYLENPVLVYTMGKVGSSTIVNSLRKLKVPEMQPHSLTYSRKGSYFVLPELSRLEKTIWGIKSQLIKVKAQLYLKSKVGKKIKIISLTREPISRNISAFFEQIHHITDRNIEEISTSELIDLFWKFANHQTPLIWFDQEIKELFGIDIFDFEFDKKNGAVIINEGDIQILLMTLEKLKNQEAKLASFLGIEEISLSSTNRSEKKNYNRKYNQFMNQIEIPDNYIKEMYESKYMKHFYTQDEINDFKKKWIKNQNGELK